MNERMLRLGGKHAAEFVTAFDETTSAKVGPGGWVAGGWLFLWQALRRPRGLAEVGAS